MTPKAKENFEALVLVEAIKLREATSREMGQEVADASSRGMLRSSMAIHKVVAVAKRSVPVLSRVAYQTLLRVAAAHEVQVHEGNVGELASLLQASLEREVEVIRAMVRSSTPFKSSSGDQFSRAILSELDKALAVEMQRNRAELDLVAAESRKSTSPHTTGLSVTNNTFNAPVAVVQQGLGHSATVTQRLDANASDALNRAFDLLLLLLASEDGSTSNFDAPEVKELVIEAKAEVAKPKPNATKLRTLTSGIGKAIEFAPKFQDAFEALKWAAEGIGGLFPS